MNVLTLFEAVLEASLLAIPLVLLIAALQWVAGRRLGPAWRFALWAAVLVRLLLPSAPESRFSIFNAPRWFPAAAEPKITIQLGEVPGTRPVFEVISESAVPEFGSTVPTKLVQPEIARPQIDWKQIAAVGWISVTAMCLLRLLAGAVLLAVKIRRHHPVETSEALEAARRELNARTCPRLVELEGIGSPALFGLFSPALLVPRRFTSSLSESELRHVFLHEMAHLKRGDLLLNWVMAIAQAIHWFNPFVWYALRQMRLERELACDQIALRASPPEEIQAYGQTILRLLAGTQRHPLPSLVGMAEEKHSARKRLAQIATFSPAKSRLRHLGWVFLIVIALCGLTNAQLPSSAPATEAPQLGPQPVTIPDLEEKLIYDFTARPVTNLSLEGKTVAEAIKLVQAQLPEHFRWVEFYWRQQTNITGIPGVYSANAVGYITSPLHQSAAKAIKLSNESLRKSAPGENATLELTNASIGRVFELITRAAPEPLDYEFAGGQFTFFQRTPAEKMRTNSANETLVRAARRLLDDGRLQEAEAKLQQALTLDSNDQSARHYLALVKEQRQETNAAAQQRVGTAILIDDARLLLELGKLDEAEAKLKEALRLDPERRAARYYLNLVEERRRNLRTAASTVPALDQDDPFAGRWNPPGGRGYANPYARTNRVYTSTGRQAILRKMHNIVLDRYAVPRATDLAQVLRDLSQIVREQDTENLGLNFIISSFAEGPHPGAILGSGNPVIDASKGQPIHLATNFFKVEEYRVTIDPPLEQVNIVDVLNAIVRGAKSPDSTRQEIPLKYSIEDYAVVFSLALPEPEPLYTRTYRIDPNTFVQGLDRISVKPNPFRQPGQRTTTNRNSGYNSSGEGGGGIIGATVTNSAPSLQDAVRAFFAAAGVDFQTNTTTFTSGQPRPPQKAVFFNDRTGVLFARATLGDLDRIERALQHLNTKLTTQARIIEVTRQVIDHLGWDWALKNPAVEKVDAPAIAPQSAQEMLTNEEARARAAQQTRHAVLPAATLDLLRTTAEQLNLKIAELAAPKVTAFAGQSAMVSIEPGPALHVVSNIDPETGTYSVSAHAVVPLKTGRIGDAFDPASHLSLGAQSELREDEILMLVRPKAEGDKFILILISPSVE